MLSLRRLRRAMGASSVPAVAAAPCARGCQAAVQFAVFLDSNGPRNASVAARRVSTSHRSIHTSTAVAAQPQDSAALSVNERANPKPKKQQMEWNVHREINVNKTPLPEVFARLRREIATRGPSIRVRQAIDAFYFNCAQQVGELPPPFVAEIVEYFETELLAPGKAKPQPLSDSLNEGVFTAIVRLLLSQGDQQKAWAIAQEPAEMCAGKLHFRSVGPILDAQSRQGEFVAAFERWRQLKTNEIEWTKSMEDTLVQMIIACNRHHRQQSTSDSAQEEKEMKELLRDLSLASREISADNASRLRHAFQASGYEVKQLPDNKSVTPQCGACRTTLQKQMPTEAERQKLIDFIENGVPLKVKNSTTTTKDFLVPFKRWIMGKHAKAKRQGKLHYILDGPNIAYLNQNFDKGSFRFDHVDLVAQMLLREGHEVSITTPHTYLEETSKLYIRTRKAKEMRRRGKVATRQRTPEDKAMIERWREQNMLFSCRTDYLSDDIFWMYATALLGEESRVVTNDQGRDHVFTLLNNRTSGMTTTDLRDEKRISIDLLDRWRASVIVNIEIQHGELTAEQKELMRSELKSDSVGTAFIIPVENVRLVHPTPFSRVPQRSATGDLHFPIADPKMLTTKWLCIHRKVEAASNAE